MPPENYDHLRLEPIPRPVRNRKKPKSVPPRIVVHREPRVHAESLDSQIAELAEAVRTAEPIPGVSKKQIIAIETGRRLAEKRLESNGLLILDSSDPSRPIAVSRDLEMARLRERVGRYSTGEPLPERDPESRASDDGPAAPLEDVFDAIDGFQRRRPLERLGPAIQELIESEQDGPWSVLVDMYAPTDAELRQAWIDEIEGILVEVEHDSFDDPAVGVTLIRATAGRELVLQLAALDQVAVIEAQSEPSLTAPLLSDLQDLEVLDPTIEPPDFDLPALGIIDSGIDVAHPMLAPAVLEASAIHPALAGNGNDEFGHGTMVAGLALYGNVASCAQEGEFVAPFPIASVRIFDDEGRVPSGVNPARLISEAIETLVEESDCRVICLSLGDHNEPFLGGRSNPLAAMIDDLARAWDVVVVIPTGNIEHGSMLAPAQLLGQWPRYLTEPGNELLSPSQAALAITVGGFCTRDVTDIDHPRAAVSAAAGGPAPYTRRGPGVRNAQKPELVADGGNWVYDRSDGSILDDVGTAVISLSARPDLLFDTAIGTSFSAAQIANALGRLACRYPNISASSLRALLLQGAMPLGEIPGLEPKEAASIVGHGALELSRCEFSTPGRAVMLAEDALRPDTFHVYRIPANTDFFTLKSKFRGISVSLAFDPPVRYRRFDYAAFQMEAAVVRGLSEDEVFHLASSANDGKLTELSKRYLKTEPTSSQNGRSVNQLARYRTSTRPQSKFQDDWYVVVRSLNKWMRDRSPQPYSLAVAIEVESSTELYLQLEAELRATGRIRASVS